MNLRAEDLLTWISWVGKLVFQISENRMIVRAANADEWMNEWMNELMNEWMNERMNISGMNEWMNEWLIN